MNDLNKLLKERGINPDEITDFRVVQGLNGESRIWLRVEVPGEHGSTQIEEYFIKEGD